MNITKRNISKNIASKTKISSKTSINLLESFLNLIKKNTRLDKDVKVSGFGTFHYKITVERLGRNPKSGESYIIPPRNKLLFKPSNIMKDTLN